MGPPFLFVYPRSTLPGRVGMTIESPDVSDRSLFKSWIRAVNLLCVDGPDGGAHKARGN